MTQPPCLRRDAQRAVLRQGLRRSQQRRGQGNVQGLRHVHRGFAVHVLVKQRETEEVQVVIRFRGVGEQGQCLVQPFFQIAQGARKIRQRQFPARVMGNAAGVIQGIGLRHPAAWPFVLGIGLDAKVALVAAGNPVILKPADMAGFPERRIELCRVWYGQCFAEAGDVGIEQRQRAPATVAQCLGKRGAAAAAGGDGGAAVHGQAQGHE